VAEAGETEVAEAGETEVARGESRFCSGADVDVERWEADMDVERWEAGANELQLVVWLGSLFLWLLVPL
jgi:hypothetical protein